MTNINVVRMAFSTGPLLIHLNIVEKVIDHHVRLPVTFPDVLALLSLNARVFYINKVGFGKCLLESFVG